MVSRRRFIGTAVAGLVGVPAGIGLYAWRIEPEWLEVVRRDLPVAGLPASHSGATLLQISDLHIGPKVDDEYIRQTFRTATRLVPDFVAITGDWITYDGLPAFERLARLLGAVPKGRLGTIGILGNHDYGFGWRMADVGDRVSALATEHGVQMLRNQTAIIGGLRFLGLEDVWGPHFDPGWRLPKEALEAGTIALCHNPDGADEPLWDDFSGWILAGHTHGGQCKPPFLPPPLLPVRNKRYTSGIIRVDERKQLYISRGVGYVMRVRFNVRPEVTLFRLTSAPAAAP